MSVHHPWMPASLCGRRCVDSDVAQVGRPRATLRLLGACGVLGAAMLIAPALFLLPTSARSRGVRLICLGLLSACGARLAVHGDADLAAPRGRGALVVTNHISWLDVVAVNAVTPMRALAKAEIARWPLLGALAMMAGTIFVDRQRLTALPGSVAELSAAMRKGALVNVYPEGTTRCGRGTGRFVPAPFQAAIDAGVPVRPVGLRYRVAGGGRTARAAFIGTDSLFVSAWRVVRLRGLIVDVVPCAEIAPGIAADRRDLAARAERAVRSALRAEHGYRSRDALGFEPATLERR